ncbi:DUF4249 domain-containing protein [Chitinophaga pinensis]|uniref:DUF4249 domain-containing protein n=1 Tax=Chitinophaga pinensis (strain ATCC 43595 / DSM 2588 / LMG 13176 / NBRC 15968 / NCIMB 11800 / UQM 2034) TaxID=485918 RepID=A0A979G714_CHIPD|nr:DUF4249 domain-containing protein [Chitinophaga pinensis]ACU61817.1 hypothetical protein Cpin_4370 [Chitinophaga pinensis DSM 2588]
MRIKVLLLLLLVSTISACEKSFNIPIPEEANRPVLNLLMNKDSVMIARVSLSVRLNEYGPKEVKDAVVKLYEDGNYKETLTTYTESGRTYYRGNTLAKAGATYRVSADVAGYEEISGSDKIPDTVAIEGIKMSVTRIDAWRNRAAVTVQLHDDPAIQNYYRIRMYQLLRVPNGAGDTISLKLPQYFESGDATVPILDDDTHPEFFTTDALFNGRNPVFVFRADVFENFNTMIVEISSLTYHSYNYLNSISLAEEKDEDGLSEKVIVYNNIIKGFGIVGGVAQRQYELRK